MGTNKKQMFIIITVKKNPRLISGVSFTIFEQSILAIFLDRENINFMAQISLILVTCENIIT